MNIDFQPVLDALKVALLAALPGLLTGVSGCEELSQLL